MDNATDQTTAPQQLDAWAEMVLLGHILEARDCAAREAERRQSDRIAWHVARARESAVRPVSARRLAA